MRILIISCGRPKIRWTLIITIEDKRVNEVKDTENGLKRDIERVSKE